MSTADDDNLITFGCEESLNDTAKNSSNYIQNVVYVVDDIASNAPKEDDRYKNATYSFNGTDSVYSLAQCRGNDVSEQDCLMCLNNASISTNNLCPGNNTNGAMVVRDKCFFMYKNTNFFQQPRIGIGERSPYICSYIPYNKTNDALSVVRTLAKSLLNDCKKARMKFASGSNTTAHGSHVLKAMVECRRDLPVDVCNTFLTEGTTSLLQNCGNNTEGGYFAGGSYVRFAWKN